MADEINLKIDLSYVKGSNEIKKLIEKLITQTGNRFADLVQTVGTSEETLDLGDVGAGTPGLVLVINLDETNFVTLRSVTATAGSNFAKLKPGEPALFRMSGSAIYAIADTAECNVRVIVFET